MTCALTILLRVLALALALTAVGYLLPTPTPLHGLPVHAAQYSIDLSVLRSWSSADNGTLERAQLASLPALPIFAQQLASTFVQTQRDGATDAFLEGCAMRGWGGRVADYLRLKVARVLQTKMGWSRVDADALIRQTELFVASREQLRILFERVATDTRESLLDLGAGTGSVTEAVASTLGVLATRVTAVEKSPPLRRQLAARGFRAINGTGAPALSSFDVALLLNVLDRTDAPRDLLRDVVVGRLAPSGLLVIATPLPFCDKVWEGALGKFRASRRPKLPLRLPEVLRCGKGVSGPFELAAAGFLAAALGGLGLEVVSWTRLPYLSSGDAKYTHYAFNSAVFVLRHVNGAPAGRKDPACAANNAG